jgi:leucyl aminopeptidase
MNIELSSKNVLELETPCLVVPIWSGEELSDEAAALDEKLSGLVREVIAEDGFKGGAGETRVLYPAGAVAAQRLVLCGWGKREKLDAAAVRRIAAKAARGVRALKRSEFAFVLPSSSLSAPVTARAAVEGFVLGLHVCHEYKTGEDAVPFDVESATLLNAGESRAEIDAALIETQSNIAARAWVNRPSNLKSPEYLAQVARDIAAARGLRCEVWDENRIQNEKMLALWGVGMGSDNPPRFIILEHAPAGTENDAPIILIGKGMSYDTGGYSLKPTTSMEDMKDDMGGAAAVLGAIDALAQLGINRRIIVLVPSAENMVSARAQRPGDIVTARNGKTIEVLNTDAEGRLILADALSYACELEPKCIIDFATLTGAIGVALGQEAAGLFANDDALAQQVTDAGETTGERVWRFPLWDEYRDHIKGTVSDIKNIGIERRAGSIAAAVFLEHFVTDGTKWAHVDIAAVAFIRENRPMVARGATGFGVRLAVELVRNLS